MTPLSCHLGKALAAAATLAASVAIPTLAVDVGALDVLGLGSGVKAPAVRADELVVATPASPRPKAVPRSRVHPVRRASPGFVSVRTAPAPIPAAVGRTPAPVPVVTTTRPVPRPVDPGVEPPTPPVVTPPPVSPPTTPPPVTVSPVSPPAVTPVPAPPATPLPVSPPVVPPAPPATGVTVTVAVESTGWTPAPRSGTTPPTTSLWATHPPEHQELEDDDTSADESASQEYHGTWSTSAPRWGR